MSLTVGPLSQRVCISGHHAVYFQYITILFVKLYLSQAERIREKMKRTIKENFTRTNKKLLNESFASCIQECIKLIIHDTQVAYSP